MNFLQVSKFKSHVLYSGSCKGVSACKIIKMFLNPMFHFFSLSTAQCAPIRGEQAHCHWFN